MIPVPPFPTPIVPDNPVESVEEMVIFLFTASVVIETFEPAAKVNESPLVPAMMSDCPETLKVPNDLSEVNG